MRIIRPGGRALFYAWAYEQSEGRSGHAFASQDVFVSWTQRAPGSADADERSAAAAGETADVLQRYCHVFRRGELAELVRSVEGARILDEYHDAGNWCVLAEKSAEGCVATQVTPGGSTLGDLGRACAP